MRPHRIKAPEEFAHGNYHCVTRIVGRERVLGTQAKEEMVRLMRAYEEFGGLQVLTYIVMSNHLHLLVRVPKRPEVLPDDEEILRRLAKIEGDTDGAQLVRLKELGAEEAAEKLRQRVCGRMWNISHMMRMVQQRFSQWYNRRKKRTGTLWEGRFRSTVVEDGEALAVVATYDDLNAVRAGITPELEGYRWSGYGAAMGGNRRAQAGLLTVVEGRRKSLGDTRPIEMKEALALYRLWAYEAGEERRSAEGVERRGFKPEAVAAVVAAKGKVSVWKLIRCRVRHFTDGAAIGSQEFVETVFRSMPGGFGEKRQTGARRIRFIEGGTLYALRALRKNVCSAG